MVIYIAGKMTGLTDFGRAHFLAVQRALEQAGHTVLNPAVLPTGLPDKSYLPITLAMLEAAEAVFMLNGWQESEGANAEYYVARRQGKLIYREGIKADCCALGIESDSKQADAAKQSCNNCLWGNFSCVNQNSPSYGMSTASINAAPCDHWEKDTYESDDDSIAAGKPGKEGENK